MAEEYVLIDAAPLRGFAQRLLEGAGIAPPKAELIATTLVEANLRGVDSHGIQLLNFYIDHMRAGCVNLDAEGHVVSENGACMVYSGDNGPGQIVSDKATEHAIRLAHEHGVGLVTVRESNHFGAAAHWSLKMARAGMVGITMCNASPIVAPWQGKEKRFGTNPICMALPGGSEKLFLLDMATTTVAMGKIFKAHFSGHAEVPHGWALDSEGVPTTDTAEALKGMPMPLGGYKGYGLAIMVEILCAVLSGGLMGSELGGIRVKDRPMGVGQVFIAIDAARFMPIEVLEERVTKLSKMMKTTPPAPGYDEVLMAGEPELRAEAVRLKEGSPLSKGVWDELNRVARDVAVEPPPARDILL
jgi:LDH2 family malate/lactate/ureidoglycolate dehydrogenase